MINSCQVIALSFGYVESNTTSWLIYQAEGKHPSTRKEALHSLVEYLWDKYNKETGESKKHLDLFKSNMAKCCRTAWNKRDTNNPPTHCPFCEANYNKVIENEFSITEWHEFLTNLHGSCCDNYGEHDWPENPYGWSPWMYDFNIPQNQILIIAENAEVILTQALSKIHPELRNLCSEDDVYLFNDTVNHDDDYHQMMDETTLYMGSGYGHPPTDNTFISKTTIINDYVNGAKSILVDGRYTYIKYNTGDEIWLDFKGGKCVVTNVKTYDGMNWNERFGPSSASIA